jgi:site-specific DNA recombinase
VADTLLVAGPGAHGASMTNTLLTGPADVAFALETLTAREYRRVSLDRSGHARSVDEQGDDNARARERHGLTLGGAPYVDNDRSASRYARKTRDDFARLMADLRSGAFGADVLQLWESSRGSRKVGEWVTLIDLCEEHGIKIFVTTHERIYDPANERDRRTLLEDAVDSEYESGKVSKRTRRTAAAEAAKGRPCGVAPHGLMPEYDALAGRLINWVENPSESMVPKELFKRLREGKSLGSITRAFEAAGYLNRSGKPFSQQHLRTMATKHAYCGERNHTGTIYDAIWVALVDKELFYDVQRIISAPERKKSRNGRAVHDISMIIKCGVCEVPP